jgi:hypothetical protein
VAGVLGGFAVFGGHADAAVPQWFGFGVLAGSTRPDPALADYNWDVGGRASWSLTALAGAGRAGVGLRLSHWRTRQGTGIPGAGDGPVAGMTDVQLLVKARAFSVENLDVFTTAGIGRYHLAYSPDRMTVDPGGGLAPVTVAFDAVNDWSCSLGAGLEYPVVRGLVAGAEITRSVFMLDTAHRSGSEIVTSREAFGNWNLRLSLSWMVRKP